MLNRIIQYARRRACSGAGSIRVESRMLLFTIAGLFSRTITAKTAQGRLTMSTRDRVIAARLYSRREYEYQTSIRALRFLREKGFIGRDGICVWDIGANIGFIGIGLLLSGEIELAAAFEPEPDNYALLERNIGQNGLTGKVLPMNLAIGEGESELLLELSPVNPGDHRIRRAPVTGAKEMNRESERHITSVRSRSLDDLSSDPVLREAGLGSPSLLWVDVQGYEGYVIRGGNRLVGTGIPVILEIWPYGILRSGMCLSHFSSIVKSAWNRFWVDRRGSFSSYPISVFDDYLAELGTDGYYENIILTVDGADR